MSDRDEDENSGDGFLARWSRRKRALTERVPQPNAELAAPAPEAGDVSDHEQDESPDPDALTPEEVDALPPVDSITDREVLKRFLKKGVPRAMKNAAMRRMWMLNPKISGHVDVAVDYAYDWNTPGGVPGNGGALDRDQVLAMVKRILPPREDPTGSPSEDGRVAEVAEEPVPLPGDAAELDRQSSAEAAEDISHRANDMHAVRLSTEAPRNKTLVVEPESQKNEAEADEPDRVRKQRHGGALPS